jgi:hypothetical protein
MTSVCDSDENRAAAISRFASAFSNRIGLILCGMVDDPVAPAIGICVKYPSEMYVHTSVARLCRMPPA